MQSWGLESAFNTRRTHREPTKSGVIGMIAASMGRKKDEPVEDLARLRFGVRVDQPGEIRRDYHTVKSMVKEKNAFVTNRYYIHDAAFLAGLESENRELLEKICESLQHPVFALYLGRRSCPPTDPLLLGIRELGLEDALRAEPWLAPEWRRKKLNNVLPLYIESDGTTGNEALQQDVPISFDFRGREYGYRYVRYAGTVCALPVGQTGDAGSSVQHDPMRELRRM